MGLSARLQKAIPNSYVLDQYKNKGNPLAHYEGTAEEIIEQTGGDFTHIVMSAGTGGTLTGTAKKIKEKLPHVKVVGIDPVGSILAKPDNMNDHKRLEAYHVEGIGYDFVPTVLDTEVVDYWIKTDDDESFAMGRNVIRHEGLLIGGSCGATMAGAYKFIKQENIGAGKTVGVLFADSSRNYMSKFMDDDWMASQGFKSEAFVESTKPENKGLFAKLFGF